jgi:dehydrogenase/reductase SDR family protein 12
VVGAAGLLDRLLDASVVASFDASGFRRHAARFDPADLQVDLSDRVVVVTGGNRGLGLATVSALARLGATVHLGSRSASRGRAAVEAVRAETGSDRVHLMLLDVSTRSGVRSARLPERVDVLVHNAGILPSERTSTEDGLESTLATNLVGPFLLTWRARASLLQSRDPRVIHVSSGGMYTQRLDVDALANQRGRFDGAVAYARTKRAQVVLTSLLQALWVRRVHVSAMHPGWADTPGVETSLPGFYRVMRRRLRTPDQGADTTVWLAARREAPEPRGALWFDRAVAPPHLVPGTRDRPGEREALWRQLCAWAELDPRADWSR